MHTMYNNIEWWLKNMQWWQWSDNDGNDDYTDANNDDDDDINHFDMDPTMVIPYNMIQYDMV